MVATRADLPGDGRAGTGSGAWSVVFHGNGDGSGGTVARWADGRGGAGAPSTIVPRSTTASMGGTSSGMVSPVLVSVFMGALVEFLVDTSQVSDVCEMEGRYVEGRKCFDCCTTVQQQQQRCLTDC